MNHAAGITNPLAHTYIHTHILSYKHIYVYTYIGRFPSEYGNYRKFITFKPQILWYVRMYCSSAEECADRVGRDEVGLIL